MFLSKQVKYVCWKFDRLKDFERVTQSFLNIMLSFFIYICAEALRYKPERRGFDSRWCHWNFSVT
jgi:hypothetical protein